MHLRREDLEPLNHLTKRQCSERLATTRIKRFTESKAPLRDGLAVMPAQTSVREVMEAPPNVSPKLRDHIVRAGCFARQTQKYIKDRAGEPGTPFARSLGKCSRR
jgi:hypothetical protein